MQPAAEVLAGRCGRWQKADKIKVVFVGYTEIDVKDKVALVKIHPRPYRKYDCLEQDDQVCFEMVVRGGPIREANQSNHRDADFQSVSAGYSVGYAPRLP